MQILRSYDYAICWLVLGRWVGSIAVINVRKEIKNTLKRVFYPPPQKKTFVTVINKKLSYCWETLRRESMPRIAEMDLEMTT